MSQSTFFTGALYARMSDDLQLSGMSEPAHENGLSLLKNSKERPHHDQPCR